jgi:hypothetical protein
VLTRCTYNGVGSVAIDRGCEVEEGVRIGCTDATRHVTIAEQLTRVRCWWLGSDTTWSSLALLRVPASSVTVTLVSHVHGQPEKFTVSQGCEIDATLVKPFERKGVAVPDFGVSAVPIDCLGRRNNIVITNSRLGALAHNAGVPRRA